MRTIVTVFVGMTAICSCRPAGESPALAAASNSVAVATDDHSESKWGEGEVWKIASEPSVTIGVLEGPAEYQLSRVSAATRQSDGDFVLVDGGTHEVRLYNSDGTFVRTLGGPGSGPGEFRDPTQVVVTAADSVIVWDNANYRITRFDSAGQFVGVQSVDRGTIAKAIDPPLYPGTAELLGGDQILVRLVEKTKNIQSGISRAHSGALRVSADLSRIDALMFFGDIEQVSVRAPWGPWAVAPPLARRTVTAVQPALSRACIGDQEGPEIVCFGPDTSRTVVRWNSEAAPVTEQEIATWRDTTLELYTQKISVGDARQVLAQVTVPTIRPPYSRLVLDRAGNLWVERGPANGATSESVDHMVFDRSGVLLGIVTLPPIEVLEIGDDYVMGIHRDELEVEYLQIYAIAKHSATVLDP